MLTIINLLIIISVIVLVVYVLIKKKIIKVNKNINKEISKYEKLIKDKTWQDPFMFIIWANIAFIVLLYIIATFFLRPSWVSEDEVMQEFEEIQEQN